MVAIWRKTSVEHLQSEVVLLEQLAKLVESMVSNVGLARDLFRVYFGPILFFSQLLIKVLKRVLSVFRRLLAFDLN